jgi:hypothetical protein
MDLSFKQDQKMRKAFYERFPGWDMQAPEIEWGADAQTKVTYTWNFSLNGKKHKLTINRTTGEITQD